MKKRKKKKIKTTYLLTWWPRSPLGGLLPRARVGGPLPRFPSRAVTAWAGPADEQPSRPEPARASSRASPSLLFLSLTGGVSLSAFSSTSFRSRNGLVNDHRITSTDFVGFPNRLRILVSIRAMPRPPHPLFYQKTEF
jgi:hypothetical protein